MNKTALNIRAIFVLILLTFTALGAAAQSRDANGNFQAVNKAEHDSTTTFTYTDAKGNIEPVYIGKKGAYYLPRVSKPSERNNNVGRYYRKYLKK